MRFNIFSYKKEEYHEHKGLIRGIMNGTKFRKGWKNRGKTISQTTK